MANILSLRRGDRVPDFVLPGLDGKLRRFVWSFIGDPVALTVNYCAALIDGVTRGRSASSIATRRAASR